MHRSLRLKKRSQLSSLLRIHINLIRHMVRKKLMRGKLRLILGHQLQISRVQDCLLISLLSTQSPLIHLHHPNLLLVFSGHFLLDHILRGPPSRQIRPFLLLLIKYIFILQHLSIREQERLPLSHHCHQSFHGHFHLDYVLMGSMVQTLLNAHESV